MFHADADADTDTDADADGYCRVYVCMENRGMLDNNSNLASNDKNRQEVKCTGIDAK
jgi:hypothetical protein